MSQNICSFCGGYHRLDEKCKVNSEKCAISAYVLGVIESYAMSKPVMNSKSAYEAVELQLKDLPLRDEVQAGILACLQGDTTLPILFSSLESGECFYASVQIDGGKTFVRVGPRDWSFNEKGECLGCGTML